MEWVDRPQNYKGLYGILQFSVENSQTWLDSFSFGDISVEEFRFSI